MLASHVEDVDCYSGHGHAVDGDLASIRRFDRVVPVRTTIQLQCHLSFVSPVSVRRFQ